jgi:hypothetical protein
MPAQATLRAPGLVAVPLALLAAAGVPTLMAVGAFMGAPPGTRGPVAVPDIPAEYLVLYRDAADHYHLEATGWSILAAVGKIECDHGRSPLPGCHRGESKLCGCTRPGAVPPRHVDDIWRRRQRRRAARCLRARRRDPRHGQLPQGKRSARRLAWCALRLQARRLVRRACTPSRGRVPRECRRRRRFHRRAGSGQRKLARASS